MINAHAFSYSSLGSWVQSHIPVQCSSAHSIGNSVQQLETCSEVDSFQCTVVYIISGTIQYVSYIVPDHTKRGTSYTGKTLYSCCSWTVREGGLCPDIESLLNSQSTTTATRWADIDISTCADNVCDICYANICDKKEDTIIRAKIVHILGSVHCWNMINFVHVKIMAENCNVPGISESLQHVTMVTL